MSPEAAIEFIKVIDKFMPVAEQLTRALPEEYALPIMRDWEGFISAEIKGESYTMGYVSRAAWIIAWNHILNGDPLVFTKEHCQFYAAATKAPLN